MGWLLALGAILAGGSRAAASVVTGPVPAPAPTPAPVQDISPPPVTPASPGYFWAWNMDHWEQRLQTDVPIEPIIIPGPVQEPVLPVQELIYPAPIPSQPLPPAPAPGTLPVAGTLTDLVNELLTGGDWPTGSMPSRVAYALANISTFAQADVRRAYDNIISTQAGGAPTSSMKFSYLNQLKNIMGRIAHPEYDWSYSYD